VSKGEKLMMENGVLVFILTVIGSFVLMYGFGSLFGGDDIEFTYVFMFILQFAFTTAILFQILHKVKKLENREGEKESREG
jgi:Kef-type K+ transport system membrane component KefB